MGKVIHFEITADDTERAQKFYTDAFGWKPTQYMEGYSVQDTGEGGGINGAIMKREFKAQPSIVWIGVDDIEAAVKKVKAAGGDVAGEKQIVPNTGETIYAKDTEGNIIGLIKPFPMD